MTGLETMMAAFIWIGVFLITSIVISKMERRKEDKQFEKNMQEYRLRRNRHITLDTIMEGYNTRMSGEKQNEK